MVCPTDPGLWNAIQALQLGIQYLQHTNKKTQEQISMANAATQETYMKRQQLKKIKSH